MGNYPRPSAGSAVGDNGQDGGEKRCMDNNRI